MQVRRLALLVLVLALAAAVLAPLARAGPGKDDKAPDPDRDYYFISDELIRNRDGTLTWLYATNHVGATALKASIDKLKINGLVTETRKRDKFVFTATRDGREIDYLRDVPRKSVDDENVLILKFPMAYKDIVEEFLQRFDVPEPQVYIKAKVVEVTLDSNLEYGVSWFFDRGAGTNPASNPNAFFRSARSSFRPGSFSSQPALSPVNSGLSLLFDDLGTDHGTVMATLEMLQERGSANILSEPSIVAMQGQVATLVTGQETPITDATITGSSERLSTKFKETGIRLDFRPLHVGREYVKMRVRVEVSSITGFQVVESASTTVSNPIIAQRNAETVVTIRDGMTLIIGGLYAVSEIEDKAGIPILADIPLLGVLFGTTRKTKVKSELDFFITPYILRQRLAKSVFTPPGERARLRKLKQDKRGDRQTEPASSKR